MFDYDALEDCEEGARKRPAAPARPVRPVARPTDEPDWEAPAPAGWWRVVAEKGCWAADEAQNILEWFWKNEVLAGRERVIHSERAQFLVLRDDGGRFQQMLICGPMHHLGEGDSITLGDFGVVLEALPSGPPSAEARAAHRQVIETRRTRGRLARAGGRRSLEAAKAEEATLHSAQILPDVTSEPEQRDLLNQARALSGRSFPRGFDAQDFLAPPRLTLLVNPTRTTVVGYCFYLLPPDGYLWVEQIAVEEKSRGRGFGKMLMRWALEQADALRCWAVRLSALAHAVHFYRSLGFEDFFQDADYGDFKKNARRARGEGEEETGWPMHALLQQHPKPRGFTGKSFYPFQVNGVV